MKHVVLVLLSLFICIEGSAQVTKVRGRVTDAVSGETVPMAAVLFTGTTIGVATDMEGVYNLETRERVSEITVRSLGYKITTISVKPGVFNEIDVILMPEVESLGEVVVKPGENPAHQMLKNISKNKSRNNPAEKDSYSYSSYTKMELDVTNIPPEFKNKKLQRNFGFIFEYMDTSSITGSAYLPIMISESSSDYYYRKNPQLSREIVKASRISGIEEDYTLAQFTGQMHVNVNLYDNYLNMFSASFPSPLNDHGLIYYKYYLLDSLQKDGRKIYQIHFVPKNKNQPVFEGDVYIDSLTWALESANVRMVKGLNMNWIRDLVIETQNELVNDSTWFMKQNKLLAHFALEMREKYKWASFIGHRQIDYSNIKVDEGVPAEIEKMSSSVIMDRSVLKNDESYWQDIRPYELSERERGIYSMVDSIRETPLFKNIYDIVTTAIFGYYDLGKVEIGPYYKLFSFNKLEGARFQFGGRTTSDFSKKFRISGYGAYGTKDTKLKGGGAVEYMFNSLLTSKLTIEGKHDVMQLGASKNAFTTGNVLSSIFARGNNERLTMVDQFDISFEKEWIEGISNLFGVEYRQMFPTKYVYFEKPDGSFVNHIHTTQLSLSTRLSKSEVIVRSDFDKTSFGSDYPIVQVDFTAALKGVMGSDYNYYRLGLTIDQGVKIPPFGSSEITLSGGKIFGKVPYPLLKLHEGNATYVYDHLAFSCMNFYEFASDTWGAIFWEHHFRGFFLGKIPLMKRLRLREVATAKFLWGSLKDKNNGAKEGSDAYLLFPYGMSSISKPYIEVGLGIENILRLFRVDAVWRLTHRNDRVGQKVDNFALNISMHLNF